jgi:hypothetical protein
MIPAGEVERLSPLKRKMWLKKYAKGTLRSAQQDEAYFSPVATLVKVVFSLVPRAVTAVTITIEMPPAMMAYSIAVAPDLSAMKFLSICMTPSPGRD